jgi:plastocyanin
MRNTYIQVTLVFVLIVGGYLVYQNISSNNNYSQEGISDVMDIQQAEDTKTVETFAGAHIMADGTVMTGDMKPIPGAMVLSDGTFELNDGTILTPAFDLRKKTTTPDPVIEAPNQVVIDVVGVNFSYDVTEIKVKKGDVVTINFTSAAGFHDWVLDELSAKSARVDEGEKTSVTFVADKLGTFQYYCSVKGHREKGQVGYLTVE